MKFLDTTKTAYLFAFILGAGCGLLLAVPSRAAEPDALNPTRSLNYPVTPVPASQPTNMINPARASQGQEDAQWPT